MTKPTKQPTLKGFEAKLVNPRADLADAIPAAWARYRNREQQQKRLMREALAEHEDEKKRQRRGF